MLNIVTALKIEAEPIIKHFGLKSNKGIYQNGYINLIITGSGKIKSAINTSLLLSKYPYKTLNIGIAGSDKHEINEGFFIHKISDYDSGLEYYPDYFEENSSEITCISKIGKYFELVDMESSGFFEACYKFLSVEEIILYKIVSDTPETKPKTDLIPELIKNHISVIEKLIEQKEDFFKDINEYLEFAASKIRLTQTQKNQLKQILVFYKIKQIPFPAIPDLKRKEEVREFLSSLTSSFF